MSLFGSILQKLGFNRPAAEAAPAPQVAAAPPPSAPAAPVVTAPPPPVAITGVDVGTQLGGLAAANPQKLNYLLKLLDLDSSLGARKELATELGCPAEKMGDSAQMNMWLHKTVLRKLADNGGNVPKELLS